MVGPPFTHLPPEVIIASVQHPNLLSIFVRQRSEHSVRGRGNLGDRAGENGEQGDYLSTEVGPPRRARMRTISGQFGELVGDLRISYYPGRRVELPARDGFTDAGKPS